jgi:hypothetical protein
MTQALNLANFANNLNSGGATSNAGLQNSAVTVTAGTGMSGGGSASLGGTVTLTNAGVTSVTGAGTVSVSASTGSVTITGTGGSGTVTSVATGNGLSGGTITSTGTLIIACPTYNTVGAYVFGQVGAMLPSSGGNYAAGAGVNQCRASSMQFDCFTRMIATNNLSGTWKWMAGSGSSCYGASTTFGILCRVS